MPEQSITFTSVILDIDGVLWIAGTPTQGAAAFLDNLRSRNVPFCFLTNGCSFSKAERHNELRQAGLAMREDQLVTPAEVTKQWLRAAAADTIMYLGAPSTLIDVAQGFRIRECGPVDAVVVGDFFAHYDRALLQSAARAVLDGAPLVAMQRNAVWSDGKDWFVDNGFWVAGLEYVTGRKAIVMGKPNRGAYLVALERLGRTTSDYSRTAFISDDMLVDLKGAKNVGLSTIYFGSARRLPQWVDYSARDMAGLVSMIIGHCHD